MASRRGSAEAILLRAPREASRPRRRPAPPPVIAEAGCGTAAVMLSLEPVRGGCRQTLLIDRFSVWRDGSHALWLGPEGQ
ncbi:hypothetical protein ACFQX4_00625 [Roseomonas sp. GCM10028921]